jgi:MYXO-CTERM domain-containing protein
MIPLFSDHPELGICPPPCTDVDGDGACADVDCDDQDVTSFPGAEELCDDGRDNDCDGDIDALDDACGEDDPDAGVDGGSDADLDADTDAGTDATTDVPSTNPQKKKDTFACRAMGGHSTDSLPTAGWLFALALLLPALRRRRNRRS